MDDAALINHESRSVSEIPLVRRTSSISSTLSSWAGGPSPPREPTASGNNAALASAGEGPVAAMPIPMRTGSVPASTAAATADEDVSKLDLAIMACTTALLMTMTVTIGGLSWKTPWKVLYGSLMIVSLVSTITGFMTAGVIGRARTGRSRLSPFCARLGLLVASPLFVVFLSCKFAPRFGCLGGVAAVAVFVVVLAVAWVLSEPPPEEEGASVVELPPDAP